MTLPGFRAATVPALKCNHPRRPLPILAGQRAWVLSRGINASCRHQPPRDLWRRGADLFSLHRGTRPAKTVAPVQRPEEETKVTPPTGHRATADGAVGHAGDGGDASGATMRHGETSAVSLSAGSHAFLRQAAARPADTRVLRRIPSAVIRLAVSCALTQATLQFRFQRRQFVLTSSLEFLLQ